MTDPIIPRRPDAECLREIKRAAFWRGFYSVIPECWCYVWGGTIIACVAYLWVTR